MIEKKTEKSKDKFVIIIFSIIMIILLCFSIYYFISFKLAIQKGAESTVTALQMVVACQQLSNITTEQIKEQYIKTFIK